MHLSLSIYIYIYTYFLQTLRIKLQSMMILDTTKHAYNN